LRRLIIFLITHRRALGPVYLDAPAANTHTL